MHPVSPPHTSTHPHPLCPSRTLHPQYRFRLTLPSSRLHAIKSTKQAQPARGIQVVELTTAQILWPNSNGNARFREPPMPSVMPSRTAKTDK